MKTLHLTLFILLITGLTACMPKVYPPGIKNQQAQIGSGLFITEDGQSLPLRQWLPKAEPKAILIALHGFNDYSHFFDGPGKFFSDQGIACYAYDQRGFGASPHRGLWAGGAAYIGDLKLLTTLLKQRYPNRPVYLLGESMGGAVVISAMSKPLMPDVDGIILSAPALWARSSMPWYQTSLLWTLAHSLPWLTLTGQSVKVMPSDNIEMLRALGRDPWVIKGTRVETIYGLANLMDEAYDSASSLNSNTLMLYGEKDEIIPKKPTYDFLQKFLATRKVDKKVAFYQQGYHMLLRDLQAPTTWKDIAAWINKNQQKLPSGADHRAQQVLAQIIPQTRTK
ncbi:MAG: alpha/beta hydrolase [Methylococcaceae bacterium]|nr:alpha/beta hydrolase [Methylococcaceae bacterium]